MSLSELLAVREKEMNENVRQLENNLKTKVQELSKLESKFNELQVAFMHNVSLITTKNVDLNALTSKLYSLENENKTKDVDLQELRQASLKYLDECKLLKTQLEKKEIKINDIDSDMQVD